MDGLVGLVSEGCFNRLGEVLGLVQGVLYAQQQLIRVVIMLLEVHMVMWADD